jgi:thymidylate synthase (FAD)
MVIERQDGLDEQPYNVDLNEWYKEHVESSLALYNEMIEAGVAPEQARMVLPQSMYTEWYWTGSLSAYARMCKQRLDPHAQKETRDIAVMINDIIQPLFPISWEALTT